MRKSWGIFITIFLLQSCEPTYHATRNEGSQSTISSNQSINYDNYDELIKAYKPETAEVLTDLLNDSSSSPRTSIVIDNQTNCNFVVTVKSGNLLKKIPATKGKLSYVMVDKNQNYTITGNICGRNFKQSERVVDSYKITLK